MICQDKHRPDFSTIWRWEQRIEKAKKKGVYKGRPVDQDKHERIQQLLEKGSSIRKSADLVSATPSTLLSVERTLHE